MRSIYLTVLLCVFVCVTLSAQPSYTANDVVTPYTGNSYYGTNMGYHAPWTDMQLADIAAGGANPNSFGMGCKSLRPALYEHFLEQYGYNIKVQEFRHYESLGLTDNTVFVGFPSNEHKDPTQYCPGTSSEVFKNLYTDIWDNGENGTPINDENYYALYLYKMVHLYKDYVKFWEIWNEPDLDHSGNAFRERGEPGNWWDTNPAPCDFKLKAPAYFYVRLLRISYEVIKTIDPDAYVAVGGIGYPSFLDVILRNSDNPNDGSINGDYPLKGGAYFDVLSYHSYPHIDGSLREWNNDIGGFDYFRHSDAAAFGVIKLKRRFEDVLEDYGYDGDTYPEKEFIITESNIPRVQMGEHIGSDEAQRNFIIKTLVRCQKNDIRQFHIYNLGEGSSADVNLSEFNFMGLYKKLEGVQPYQQEATDGGIAFKTTSTILHGATYDPVQTAALNMPGKVNGAAFKDQNGEYIYVLWAKTKIDQSESVTANYTFPDELGINNLERREWDFSITGDVYTHDSPSLQLTGAPFFLVAKDVLPVEYVTFDAFKQGTDVKLEWVTIAERENSQFILEYKTPGRDFETLTTVQGAGTSILTNYYQYIHDRPLRGKNYYRLRQVSADGQSTIYEIKTVEIEIGDLFTVKPTLANEEILIELYEYREQDIVIEVFDIIGRQRQEAIMLPDENDITLDVRNLEIGHYFLRIEIPTEGFFIRRFVVAH